MSSGKKPTMKEVKNVINNVLIHMSDLNRHVQQLDGLLFKYIKYNKDTKKFGTFLDKEVKDGEAARSSTKGDKKSK
tara:strand:- start:337 stop:564 length:228 start_codon:yes stop_codon:yes gene_type:complete